MVRKSCTGSIPQGSSIRGRLQPAVVESRPDHPGAGYRERGSTMKVAYVFSTSGHTASYKLGKMILPQLEEGRHGVEDVLR